MRFKVAIVQTKILSQDPEKNIRRAEAFVKEAVKSGADLVVFPENFVSGPIVETRFIDYKGNFKKTFQKMAKKYNVDLVPGSFYVADKRGIYNAAFYIDQNGVIRGKQKKVNLWHSERKYINSGFKLSVFNTRFGRTALVICWGLSSPELFRKMVLKGTRIVIIPSFWANEEVKNSPNYSLDTEKKFVNSLCEARALENEMIVIFANAAGTAGYSNTVFTSVGRSQVTAPLIGVLKRLNHNKEEILYADISTSLIDEAEKIFKIRRDLKTRAY